VLDERSFQVDRELGRCDRVEKRKQRHANEYGCSVSHTALLSSPLSVTHSIRNAECSTQTGVYRMKELHEECVMKMEGYYWAHSMRNTPRMHRHAVVNEGDFVDMAAFAL